MPPPEEKLQIAKEKAKARAQDLLVYSQRQADRVVSPATRQKAIDSTKDFISSRPILSLFIAVQILFAIIPLLIFTNFILITSTITTLFFVGLGLFFLVPSIFLGIFVACFVWLWLVGIYLVAQFIYARLPVSVKGKMQVRMPEGKHVLFHKSEESNGDLGLGVVKAEAVEVRD
ncbi:hypothetical protein GGS20DRAFT_582732 [Poronia punctata]|nr:hypothetical protein GGS20DRAFT_582732 [Poronia punctata]